MPCGANTTCRVSYRSQSSCSILPAARIRWYSAVPGYGVMMWNVAVSMPWAMAQSTVRSNTSGPSPSMPNTKLALTITPASCSRRTTAA